MIYPIFKTRYSFYKSILNIEANKSEEDAPDNILDIAEEHQLPYIAIVDDAMAGFLHITKCCKKRKMPFKFGLRCTFADYEGKNQHKCVIFLSDGDKSAYENLIKLSTICNKKAASEQEEPYLTYDEYRESQAGLHLFIPFYDSFIFNNMFTLSSFAPSLSGIDYTLVVEDHDTPFDAPLKRAIENFAKLENKPIVNWHTCYYKNNSDIEAYQCLKLMNRSDFKGKDNTLNNPNLNDCCSDKFSFEHFLKLQNNG